MALDTLDKMCNIEEWHSKGFTGKGVTVWVMEGWTDHSRCCRKRVLDAAPEANVIIGAPGRSIRGGKIQYYIAYEFDEHGNRGEQMDIEDFIRAHNIRVITSSTMPDSFGTTGTVLGDFWADLIERYDLCVFRASANDSKKDKDFSRNVAWIVGALVWRNGKPVRASYSNGGQGLDFSESVGWWNGTSSATPFLAGKCAVLLQRYPRMTYKEVYEYLKAHVDDLGDKGEDPLYGHGWFTFPPVGEVPKGDDDVPEITTTKVLVDGVIKEVKRVMVNNENYIRLRDMEDVLGICDVDYDAEKNLPIVRKG